MRSVNRDLSTRKERSAVSTAVDRATSQADSDAANHLDALAAARSEEATAVQERWSQERSSAQQFVVPRLFSMSRQTNLAPPRLIMWWAFLYLALFFNFKYTVPTSGHRIVAIMAAFQAAETGPIPVARSKARSSHRKVWGFYFVWIKKGNRMESAYLNLVTNSQSGIIDTSYFMFFYEYC